MSFSCLYFENNWLSFASEPQPGNIPVNNSSYLVGMTPQQNASGRVNLEWSWSRTKWKIKKGCLRDVFSTFSRSFKNELINFYSPWNHQKNIGFLMIFGGDWSKLLCSNSLNIRNKIWWRSPRIFSREMYLTTKTSKYHTNSQNLSFQRIQRNRLSYRCK